MLKSVINATTGASTEIAPTRTYWRRISSALALDRTAFACSTCIAFTIIYLLTLTRYYTFDAISYSNSITAYDKAHDLFALYHPHHLLFNLTGWIIWRACQLWGYIGGPLEVLQRMNAVIGGVGIGLFTLTLRMVLTRSKAIAVLFSVGLGLSFGYWLCATDGRVNMPSLTFQIAAFLALVMTMQAPSKQRAAACGILTALATLYHESAIFFMFAAWVGIWLAEYPQSDKLEENRARRVLLSIYTIICIAVIVIPYLIVGIGVLKLTSPEDFKNWAARYAVLGWWWDFRVLHNLRLDAYAIRKCFFTEPVGKQGTFHISHAVIPVDFWLYMSVLSFWLVGVYTSLIALPLVLKTHYRPYILVVVIWFLANTAFFTVWQPNYFVFRAPAIIAATALLAMVSSHYRAKRIGPIWLVGIGLWCGIQGVDNFVFSVKPHMEKEANPYILFADDFKNHSKPYDILLLKGTGDDAQSEVYVPYFSKRTVYSIHTELAHNHENFDEMNKDFQSKLALCEAKGGHIYGLNNLYIADAPPEEQDREQPITQDMIKRMLTGREKSLAWVSIWMGKTKRKEAVWQISEAKATHPVKMTAPAPSQKNSHATLSKTPSSKK